MDKTDINIHYTLRESKRTLRRNFKDKKRIPGTRQLEAHLTWNEFQKHEGLINYPNEFFFGDDYKMSWKPGKNKYTIEVNPGMAALGLTNIQMEKLRNIKKNYNGFKINAKGELIKYNKKKLQTGIFLLPECWNSKKQIASPPYDWVNNELIKINHIIRTTYNEQIGNKSFTGHSFQKNIKERMANGLPQTITISAVASSNTISTIHAISEHFAKQDGFSLNKATNPNDIPDDMREFISYYHINRKRTKDLTKETIKKEEQLRHKLDRWFEQKGRILSVTKSTINEVGEFFKWRTYDNEENGTRNTNKIKSKIQVNKIKKEAVSMSTLNNTKKSLSLFFNRAVEEFDCKIFVSTKNVIFKLVDEKNDENKDVFLSMDQLKQLVSLQIEKGTRLYNSRSLFVLGCLSGGYRIKDLITLPKPQKELFENGKEYYTFDVVSHKTHVHTKAPIPEELNYLVEEYPFGAKIIEQYLRDDIKSMGKLCGWNEKVNFEILLADNTLKPVEKKLYEALQVRTCRKTYCSLLYNFWGLTVVEASAFSGHTSDEFYKYLKVDRKKKAQDLINKFNVKPIFLNS